VSSSRIALQLENVTWVDFADRHTQKKPDKPATIHSLSRLERLTLAEVGLAVNAGSGA
jgi:hypothetical protein